MSLNRIDIPNVVSLDPVKIEIKASREFTFIFSKVEWVESFNWVVDLSNRIEKDFWGKLRQANSTFTLEMQNEWTLIINTHASEISEGRTEIINDSKWDGVREMLPSRRWSKCFY